MGKLVKEESQVEKAQACHRARAVGSAIGKLVDSDRGELLNEEDARRYRRLIARANYLVPDRVDLAFTVKALARRMASPSKTDWENLSRMARCLAGRPRMRVLFEFQADPGQLVACSDSHWAGCPHTRRGSSGVYSCAAGIW